MDAMRLPIFQIDAFADAVFRGNPAAVCPLDDWLDDATMQAIAAENNLSETAFVIPAGEAFGLRWFTPTVEVDLCGHATLATAFYILERVQPGADTVRFDTRSGRLTVTREGEMLVLDFPAHRGEPCATPPDLAAALGVEPAETLAGPNYLAVLETEAAVAALAPDFQRMLRLAPRGVIATAPGESCDFVSRYFAPAHGVPEDPVTGSAHCMLTPYWSTRLGKRRLEARQISRRGGALVCEDRGERVAIGGRAVTYLEGLIRI